MVVFTTVTQQGGGEDKSQEFEPPYGPLMVRLWSAYGRLLMQLLALHPDR